MERIQRPNASTRQPVSWSNGRLTAIALALLALTAVGIGIKNFPSNPAPGPMSEPLSTPSLLTDPFLQSPTPTSVRVVWFTEFPGRSHQVSYGEDLSQVIQASTLQLSRVREDDQSHVGGQVGDGSLYDQPTYRDIWRHEAVVRDLAPGMTVPYHVTSVNAQGESVTSDRFSLGPSPQSGAPLNILLTSDHQLMPMTPANLQAITETIEKIDAVFMAGDLVNIPDRASEWFDDNRGRAFFPALQGRARAILEDAAASADADAKSDASKTLQMANQPLEQLLEPKIYTGGAIIQSAPLFTAIGNHEVMGRWSMELGLNQQFNDPVPRAIATQRYRDQSEPEAESDNSNNTASDWITDHSFNTITYDEIFSLPHNPQGNSKYYAVTLGDVRLVVLYATNIWRTPSLNANARGRYREADADLDDAIQWGYGQHIFEPIGPGSAQYEWLAAEVRSPEFNRAKYKIVMFHHPPHSLGGNVVPAYTDPVQSIDRFDDGHVKAVRYEYPKEQDYLTQDVVPLLASVGVDLVFFGHSHLWNRFTSPSGTHFLESSNVGNTYGAFWQRDDGSLATGRRPLPIGYAEIYVPWGDPNGLDPIMPTLVPLVDDDGVPQPFVASNDISVFSVFNTDTGLVSSYRFDTRTPDQPAIKFDEFSLK